MGVDVSPVLIYGVEWEDEYELNELIKGTKYYKNVLAYCKKWDDNFTEDDYLGAGACADNIPNYFISNYSEYGGEGGYLGVELSVGCPEEFLDSYRDAKEQWDADFPNVPGEVILDVYWR